MSSEIRLSLILSLNKTEPRNRYVFILYLGMKLNSLFVPENESCYIPQVCRVCQSTRADSRILGLEVVSFTSPPERKQDQPRPFKQVLCSSLCNYQSVLALSYGIRGGQMFSALASGFEPWPSLCVAFLGETVYLHSASLAQVYKWVPAHLLLGETLR